jgi:hypothetical protein
MSVEVAFRKNRMSSKLFDLSGRTGLVTGSARGLVGREAARRMIKRGLGGKITNIGSLTSEAARARTAPYTVAKGGIKLLTRAMTSEWAVSLRTPLFLSPQSTDHVLGGLGSASEILQRSWKFSKCQTIAIEEDRL